VIVLDTHILLWWVSGSTRLPGRARRAIAGALRAGPAIASAISLFEIATAARRGRVDLGLSLVDWFAEIHRIAELKVEPVSAEIARIAGGFADPMPRDPADRIIAATAIALETKLLTADQRLRRSPQLQTVW